MAIVQKFLGQDTCLLLCYAGEIQNREISFWRASLEMNLSDCWLQGRLRWSEKFAGHGWGECLLSYSEGVWARRLGDLRADDFALKRDVLRPFAFPRVWCLPGVWWYSCAGTLPNVLVIAKNHFLWRKFILVWQVKWNAAKKAFLDTYTGLEIQIF